MILNNDADYGDDEVWNETDIVCQTPPGAGVEGNNGGWDVLVNWVLADVKDVPLPKSPDDPRESPHGWGPGGEPGTGHHPAKDDPPYRNGLTPPRLFCGMYTYHKRQYLLKAATESWAFHCDGFVAFSMRQFQPWVPWTFRIMAENSMATCGRRFVVYGVIYTLTTMISMTTSMLRVMIL